MQDFFSKCGFNCGRCVAYKDSAITEEDRQCGSDGWKKYFGIKIKVDRMYCDGCQTPDNENPVQLAPGCTIRKCAMQNNVETCAHCSAYYSCMHDLKIFDPDVNRENIEARIGESIPDQDYLAFIEPYKHLKHLEEIRGSLQPNDIREASSVKVRIKSADFPDNLPLSQKELSAFKSLHRILSEIITIKGDTFAQQKILKKRRDWLMNLFWAFGLFGELKEDDGQYLVIDSEAFFTQKISSQYSKVKFHFELLKEYGVHCTVVPIAAEYLTPTGWLRGKRVRDKDAPWLMKMSIDKAAGGIATIKALKTYAVQLDKKYGKKAFGYFSKADMASAPPLPAKALVKNFK